MPSVIAVVAAVIAIAHTARTPRWHHAWVTRDRQAILDNPLPRWRDFVRLLRETTEGDDVTPLARALVGVVGNGFMLGRHCKKLPPAIIRALVAQPIPPEMPAWARVDERLATLRNLVFVKELVPAAGDDAAVTAAWQAALQALLDLQTTYAWGSKQRRQKVAAVAASPSLLAAVQTAVVACSSAPGGEGGRSADWLAVLVADGSEASADAIMPYFHRAITDGTGLELLERLRTHAADTPPNRAMLAAVEERLARRSATSPALALAPLFGLDADARELWLHLRFSSVEHNRAHVPLIQASLQVDSRARDWMALHVARVQDAGSITRTSFNQEKVWGDDLELGTAPLLELPGYVARAASKLGIAWDWDGAYVRTGLRGDKRAAIVSWLRGSRR